MNRAAACQVRHLQRRKNVWRAFTVPSAHFSQEKAMQLAEATGRVEVQNGVIAQAGPHGHRRTAVYGPLPRVEATFLKDSVVPRLVVLSHEFDALRWIPQ